MINEILRISESLCLCVKKHNRVLWISSILACAVVCAAEPAHVPMEWKCVQTNAIAAWKSANAAPDGIVADAASRSVRFLAEATGLEDATTVEFLAIGPLSDRAYESLFVTVPSPAAIASALERVGVPRGVPPDIAGARLWPCGEKLTLSAKRLKPDAPSPAPLALADLLNDTAAKDEGAILHSPFLYTGGQRDDAGAVVAATNIPCAVFALYSHSPSLLLLDGQFDQSSAYGRFRSKIKCAPGDLFEMTLRWDGRTTVLRRDVTFTVANMKEQFAALRSESEGRDLFVCPSFGAGTTVEEAASIAHALSMLDGKALKISGAASGKFFFRAFLPDSTWRERSGRIFQPFEVHVAADGKKRFVFVEEDWSGEGLDPVLKPKETPFAEWKELPGLIAKTGEAGGKINVLFIFAPKTTPVSALEPVVPALGSRITTYYVFGEDVANPAEPTTKRQGIE